MAIEIPDSIKSELAQTQRRLINSGAVDASWTRGEGMHLTLKFLGEVPEAKIPDIMNALTHAAGSIAGFRIDVAGVGTFPNPKNARVVWAGLSGDVEMLLMLRAAVEESMVGLGFEREERKFTPHLTLGRIKRVRAPAKWLKALEDLREISLSGFEVTSVRLMKSELEPSGAVYTEIGKVALCKSGELK